MAGNDFLAHVSAGLVLGVSDIFSTVAQELKEKLGRTVDPYEVERAVPGEGDIRAQGRAYPQPPSMSELRSSSKNAPVRFWRR